MPYPTNPPETKHDVVSPPAVSISSNRIEPLYDSAESIVHQIKNGKVEMKKLALKIYMYDDAPSIPRKVSATLYFAGFCPLAAIYGGTNSSSNASKYHFDFESFFPQSGMTICHVGVKRDATNDPNVQKFTMLCRNLRTTLNVALIQCPKTSRAGFLLPMNDFEDGFNFAAYLYIGEVDAVERMLKEVERERSRNSNGGGDEEISDEPIWRPDEDDNEDDNDKYSGNNNREGESNDNDLLWQPPGSNDNTNTNTNTDTSNGEDMWQPPGMNGNDTTTNNNDNDNGDTNMWQPNNDGDTDQGFGFGFGTDIGTNTGSGTAERTTNNGTEGNGGAEGGETTFHADSGAAAADKFYSELTRSLDTRAESILYHMRNFNGWVKATQIAELDPRTTLTDPNDPSSSSSKNNSKKRKRTRHPLRILDLACGKGGDLGKWVLHNRGVGSYVGSDVARGSLVDAAIRARNMRKQLKNKCTFICADLGHDVPGRPRNGNTNSNGNGNGNMSGQKMQKLSSWSLENDHGVGNPVFRSVRGGGIQPKDKFDVVSIQFAIHYMMSSEKRAKRFFQTVSELLDIGGNLIATTIDARVVIDHMMDSGNDFHFDGNDDGDGGNDDNNNENNNGKHELVTIKVGKDACQLKFERDIVKRIFSNSGNISSSSGKLNPNLFGLQYVFTLVEGQDHAAGVGQAVDLPEWLTPLPVLKELAEQAGLTMEYASNFHEFYEQRKDPNLHHAAHSALYNMHVLNWNGSISDQEWDISRMYVAVKFRKDRESSLVLDDDDDGVMDDDDDDDDDDENAMKVDQDDTSQANGKTSELAKTSSSPSPSTAPPKPKLEINMRDPKVMMMYTKAMKIVKQSYDGDWKALSSDERKALINIELAKMLQ